MLEALNKRRTKKEISSEDVKTGRKFMQWYNNRLYGILDLETVETPNEAFI